MERKFKAGDSVVLKSGSPRMTVIRYNENEKILCTWMVKNEKKEETFYEIELKKWSSPIRWKTILP